MGTMIKYKCPNCGKEKEFLLGIGMTYPMALMKAKEKGLNGKLGKDIKEAILKNSLSRVEAEECLYYCEGCGYTKSEPSYDVSYPKQEYQNNPELSVWDSEKYEVVKAYTHKCPKCKKEMKKYSKIPLSIKCPKCNLDMLENSFGNWD